MELGLAGKRAVVCGASQGLGAAIARGLYAEGAHVFLVSRDLAKLEKSTAEWAKANDPRVHCFAADLSKSADVERLLTELKIWGQVDILINNTGGPTPSSAATTTAEAWRLGYEQLVSATIALTQAVLPGMRERGFGRIITVTSTSVVEPIPMLAVSTAMRSAVTGFCKTLAHEVAAEGVTVHTVMPGVIHTARTEALRKAKAEREKTSLETELEKTRLQIPMKRLGKPEEFADVVVFLASARASYLTGLNIAVDGGARRGI